MMMLMACSELQALEAMQEKCDITHYGFWYY